MQLKTSIKEFGAYLGDKDSFLDTNHPHLAEKIVLHWGYKEFYPFMSSLFVVDINRNRAGFSLKVIKELYILSEMHDRLFPEIRDR